MPITPSKSVQFAGLDIPVGRAEWLALTRRIAVEYGLDERYFARMIAFESGYFNPDIIFGRKLSPKGAAGIAQFMPNKAKEEGVNPLDPESSLRAAAKVMKGYLAKYGSWGHAVVAWNAGPGVADRGLTDVSAIPSDSMDFVRFIGATEPKGHWARLWNKQTPLVPGAPPPQSPPPLLTDKGEHTPYSPQDIFTMLGADDPRLRSTPTDLGTMAEQFGLAEPTRGGLGPKFDFAQGGRLGAPTTGADLVAAGYDPLKDALLRVGASAPPPYTDVQIRTPQMPPLSMPESKIDTEALLGSAAELLERAMADQNAEPEPVTYSPGTAIAAGLSAALDPEGFGRVMPLIEKARALPYEKYERAQARTVRGVQMAQSLAQTAQAIQIDRREQAQIANDVNLAIRALPEMLQSAVQVVNYLGRSDDPDLKMQAENVLKEVMYLNSHMEGIAQEGPAALNAITRDTLGRGITRLQETTTAAMAQAATTARLRQQILSADNRAMLQFYGKIMSSKGAQSRLSATDKNNLANMAALMEPAEELLRIYSTASGEADETGVPYARSFWSAPGGLVAGHMGQYGPGAQSRNYATGLIDNITTLVMNIRIGSQMSAKEMVLVRGMVPHITDSAAKILANLIQLRRFFRTKMLVTGQMSGMTAADIQELLSTRGEVLALPEGVPTKLELPQEVIDALEPGYEVLGQSVE